MPENILDIIRVKYHSLNATEQKIASYTLDSASRVQNMSISELARESGVSEATVSRFCRRLDLSGFFALKLELAKASRSGESAPRESFCADVENEAKSAVTTTVARLSKEALERAAEMIERAGRIVAVGYGSTSIAAAELVNVFSTVSLKFSSVADVHSQTATVSLMSKGDLLILFSYSGSTVEGTELLRFAKERGIPTLLLTHFEESPSAKYADTVLCYGVDESPYRVGSVPVRIAQMVLIDALFRTYEDRNRADCGASLCAVTEALANKHI